MAYQRLGDLLVASGAITEEQLQKGLELQKGTTDRLGTVLIKNNIITEDQLIDSLTMQLGIEYIDLTTIKIPVAMAQALPKNIAKKYLVVPVATEKDQLFLAMADPMNFYAIEEVKKSVKKKVVPMIANTKAIEHTINILYGSEGAAKAIEDLEKELGTNEDEEIDLSQITDLDNSPNNAPTIRLVNSILERAINERASDIHLEPREIEMVVRMRIDGVMRNILTIPKNAQASVISRIKIMAGINIAERRIPQDGRSNIRIRDKEVDLRISTLPTIHGEKIVIRLLDKSQGTYCKEDLGLSPADSIKYDKLLTHHNGVVLIAGPTGSGKSSTLYTMIDKLNNETVNIVSLEDPVEFMIVGINQVQINEKVNMTFANGLRSILRQDPDVISVGEIRDGETAEIAMRAAITGHTVLSTIHTSDSVSTIERLFDIGVEPYLVSVALKGVISQRLVRRICPNCKKEYVPSIEEQEKLGLKYSSKRIFYKGEGCQNCFQTGYKGRIAVFEILNIDNHIRSLITEQANRKAYEDYLNTVDYVSLKDNSIRLVEEGITTSDEVLRVIVEE